MEEPLRRSVSTIFCDDIRLEVGNKISLIGVYSGALIVPEFPVVLPKLCIVVTVVTPHDEPPRSLAVRLFQNDSPFIEHTVGPEILSQAPSPVDPAFEAEPDHRIGVMAIPIVVSPLKVEQPMLLRVRAIADGRELRAPALMIRKAA
jgi:hypothetical protein